jgi:hypothetical protein
MTPQKGAAWKERRDAWEGASLAQTFVKRGNRGNGRRDAAPPGALRRSRDPFRAEACQRRCPPSKVEGSGAPKRHHANKVWRSKAPRAAITMPNSSTLSSAPPLAREERIASRATSGGGLAPPEDPSGHRRADPSGGPTAAPPALPVDAPVATRTLPPKGGVTRVADAERLCLGIFSGSPLRRFPHPCPPRKGDGKDAGRGGVAECRRPFSCRRRW